MRAGNGDQVFEGFGMDLSSSQVRADHALLTVGGELTLEGNVEATRDGRYWFSGDSLKLKLPAGHISLATLVGADRAIVPWALRKQSAEHSR
jgi:hypothetical protein